jgi:hypothetical protein
MSATQMLTMQRDALAQAWVAHMQTATGCTSRPMTAAEQAALHEACAVDCVPPMTPQDIDALVRGLQP